MKITPKVLRKRARQALGAVTCLNLSNLGIGAIEELENCPKLQELDLNSNNIEEAEGIDCCSHLWNINFSYNKLSCLTELSHFYAFGTLDLSNNNLTWAELSRIRHVIILDLYLHGNPQLEKDIYYRVHAIDCLPNVWMLDGAIITSVERLQVQQLFHHSALSSHPVRRKTQDRPHSHKRLEKNLNCVHGIRTSSLVAGFPRNEVQSSDTDHRRLLHLSENTEEDIFIMRNCKGKTSPIMQLSESFLRKIIRHRELDRERCNMLLLLLVASLEFHIPLNLLSETLRIAKLNPFADVDTMNLFMLERTERTRVVSLLLSASKLDWDTRVAGCGGLYDRLYLGLYYIVADLIRADWRTRKRKSDCERNLLSARSYKSRSYASPVSRPQTAPSLKSAMSMSPASKKNQIIRHEHRMLLASEVVLLLSVVPSFYKSMETDPGIQGILQAAMDNDDVTRKIMGISRNIRAQGGDINALYEEITVHIVNQIEQTAMNTRRSLLQHTLFTTLHNTGHTNEAESEWKLILGTKNAYPKRPKSAILTSGEHLTLGKRSMVPDMYRLSHSF